jgi:hypothetical protein
MSLKTQKQFDNLVKKITDYLIAEKLSLDSEAGVELISAMFPPSPERERDIEPGLLDSELAKGLRKIAEDTDIEIMNEYPPDPERWVRCIIISKAANIKLDKDYRVYGSPMNNYIILNENNDFILIAKKYFKPIPKP